MAIRMTDVKVRIAFYGRDATVTLPSVSIRDLFEQAKKCARLGLRERDSIANILVCREEVQGELGTRIDNDDDLKDAMYLRTNLRMTRKAVKRPRHEPQGVKMRDVVERAAKRVAASDDARVLRTHAFSPPDGMTEAREVFMLSHLLADAYGPTTKPGAAQQALHPEHPEVVVYYVECGGRQFEVVKAVKAETPFPEFHCYDTALNAHAWTCKEFLVCPRRTRTHARVPSAFVFSPHPLTDDVLAAH